MGSEGECDMVGEERRERQSANNKAKFGNQRRYGVPTRPSDPAFRKTREIVNLLPKTMAKNLKARKKCSTSDDRTQTHAQPRCKIKRKKKNAELSKRTSVRVKARSRRKVSSIAY